MGIPEITSSTTQSPKSKARRCAHEGLRQFRRHIERRFHFQMAPPFQIGGPTCVRAVAGFLKKQQPDKEERRIFHGTVEGQVPSYFT